MSRTLLIGTPGRTWREWLRENRKGRDLLCLDPSDANIGWPARLTLLQDDRVVAWRFYGSLDPHRFPHVLISGLVDLLRAADEDAIVQLFDYRPTPLARHLSVLMAQLIAPERILVATGAQIDLHGWPTGPEMIEVETAFPEMVRNAQRKAQWLKLVESCEPHEIDLAKLAVEGSRLGAGTALLPKQMSRAGLTGVEYGEVCGGSLFVVAAEHPEDASLSRALDVFHCTRAIVTEPCAYANLLCSFGRQDGEDFGMGLIQSIDFPNRRAMVLSTAVAPAPVRILRLGSLRVDRDGRELGESRPWQV